MKRLVCLCLSLVLVSAIIGQGPIAYYPFNGNANDESGNGNDGDTTGHAPLLVADRFGNADAAYSFDGIDDYIDLGVTDAFHSNELTGIAWVYFDELPPENQYVKTITESSSSTDYAQDLAPAFKHNPGEIHLEAAWGNGGGTQINTLTGPLSVSVGNWHMVAYTRSEDLGTIKYYLDGKEYANIGGTGGSIPTSPQSCAIGQLGDNGSGSFPGILDDISIYNRAFSAGEIDSLFHLGGWVNNSLIADYPFNGNANDESGFEQDGIATGGVEFATPDRFGTLSSAVSFDGVDDIIVSSFDHFTTPSLLSVSLWLKVEQPPEPSGEYEFILRSNNGLGIWQLDNQIQFVMSAGETNNASAYLPYGKWAHFVGTYDGAFIRSYMNGSLIEETVHEVPISSFGNEFSFGSFTSVFWDGSMDDVRIYNSVLSENDIKSIYSEDGWPCSFPRPELSTFDKEGLRLVIPPGQETIETTFNLHNLGDMAANYTLEVVSADSSWLLYMDEPDPSVSYDGNIWKMRPDGSAKTQLTSSLFMKVFGPQMGSKIAFSSHRDGELSDIWVMNADGTGAVNLTNRPDVFDAWADWSPDGEWILFGSTRDHVNPEIYKISIRTQEVIRLTDNETIDARPKFSPDGCHFVAQVREAGSYPDIRVYSTVDGSFTDFGDPTNSDYQPSWTPSGKRVIWSARMDSGLPNIVSARPDGGDFRVELATEFAKYYPRVSPDGQIIVFSAGVFTQFSGDEIMRYNRAFHRMEIITDHTEINSEWGPDWYPILGAPDWVSISSSSGQIDVGGDQSINVSVDVSMLPVGDHTASVTVKDAEGDRLLAVYPINIRVSDDLRPQISYIEDVPEDQGNWVQVHWEASALDGVGQITQYGVLERNPFDDQWVSLGSTPALQRYNYTFLAHTYRNGNEGGYTGYSEFKVIAHTQDPEKYYSSESGFGISWDNLAPEAPTGLSAYEENDLITLNWDAPVDEDFQYFRLYRSTDENFSNEELIHETIETGYLDSGVGIGMTYYYRISAVDFNQNEGESSQTITHHVVGVDSKNLPDEYVLQNNYPNPFNPSTTIRYGIPETADVKLQIYDIAGREIMALVHESQPAGWYSTVWFGLDKLGDPVGTGVYFARINAGTYSRVIKMVYLR